MSFIAMKHTPLRRTCEELYCPIIRYFRNILRVYCLANFVVLEADSNIFFIKQEINKQGAHLVCISGPSRRIATEYVLTNIFGLPAFSGTRYAFKENSVTGLSTFITRYLIFPSFLKMPESKWFGDTSVGGWPTKKRKAENSQFWNDKHNKIKYTLILSKETRYSHSIWVIYIKYFKVRNNLISTLWKVTTFIELILMLNISSLGNGT